MENNKLSKILLACNAVLFLGLVGIYIIHFTSAPKSRANAEATEPLVKDGGLTIAYVDTDTLLANYQYAKDLEKELLAFKNQQEAYGKQQVEKFQNDYQNYLKKAGLTAGMLEYTTDPKMRKTIINYAKKNGYAYYISSTTHLR